MYIEPKGNQSGSKACVRRVTQVKLGWMIYDPERSYVPQRNRGSGANYTDAQTGEPYWIAPCRKDGFDSLESVSVHIDDDARTEYWSAIRGLPENEDQASYQSPGRAHPASK
jgi:hypothetical protein